MQGKIMAYDPDTCAGVIKGEDNQPYYFTKDEWLITGISPREDLFVLFDPGPWHASNVRKVNSVQHAGNTRPELRDGI